MAGRPGARASAANGYDPKADKHSVYSATVDDGAQSLWAAGATGQGVDVAIIDSGIAPVDGLNAPGKVVNGPDLSFESQDDTVAHLDTYGHGTHMAGIIAGRDSDAVAGKYVGDSTHFLGMAPDARLVSIKVADASGATDVSQMLAAIDWVVQHQDGHVNPQPSGHRATARAVGLARPRRRRHAEQSPLELEVVGFRRGGHREMVPGSAKPSQGCFSRPPDRREFMRCYQRRGGAGGWGLSGSTAQPTFAAAAPLSEGVLG